MELYNVVNMLGRGTFGTVHLCERKHNKQKIVIKKINLDPNAETFQTAKNEVTVLKSLDHPNIIQYYDSFTKNGTLYIVMEYASKGTLFDYLAAKRPEKLTPQVLVALINTGLRIMGND